MAPVGVQGIAAVGGLFALSFDTISQALSFSATAVRFQGWKSALVLGGLVAVLSLLVGSSGAVRLLVPRLQSVIDAQAIFSGVGLIAALAIVGGIVSSRRPRVDVAVALRARLLDFNRDGSELAVPDATLGDH